MRENAISVKNLTFRYPTGKVALKNLTFDIETGSSVAFIGANGAGKSTLLLHFAALNRPMEGDVSVLGMSIKKQENKYKIRQQVGLVMQDPDDQLFMQTLWEDVAFGPLNMGLDYEEVKRRVKKALDSVGLSGLEDEYPHHLSFGQKKRAAIATVLSMDPKIIVMDEPTANLDPKGVKEFLGIIEQLKKSGKTIIIATHVVDIIPLISERCIVMNKGEIVLDGSTKEVLTDRDFLLRYGLESPIVSRLFLEAQIEDIPITLEEAVKILKRLKKY